jgi:hypothetical protein
MQSNVTIQSSLIVFWLFVLIMSLQTVQWKDYNANEGLVRIQYKCLVPTDVFPEMKLLFPKRNYDVLSPSSYTHISVRDL